MRTLSISLILVVLFSIVAFGWLINKIYIYTSQETNPSPENIQYIQLGKQLLSYYQQSEAPESYVENWNAAGNIQMSLSERDDFPLPPALNETFNSGEALLLETDIDIGVHFLLPEKLTVFTVSFPRSQLEDNSRIELILTLSFYLGVTTIIIIWIWPLIHQLICLRNAAMRFGKGELEVRVKSQRLSYIRDIENEFNRMADRIQSLLRDNKLLSRAVSHDLKTPLARLRFGLDALSETQSEEQRQRYASRVNLDLEAMEELIDNLLQYARLDENRIKITDESICLVTLTEVLMETHEVIGKQIQFVAKQASALIRGDKRYISMLINNLLSNALRYGYDQVLVTLSRHGNFYQLSFEDNGQGIPVSQRENVLKPFWRGEDGRTEKGHGMGLAIVARIAEWHQAKLEISESESLGGAKVSLMFAQGAFRPES